MIDRILKPFLFSALAAALLYRLFPIVTGQPQLSQFFMTEDGYLMLTVARNMAIGLGMTVSDGTVPTNGVQPLATFLFAIPYLISGGDKVTSLIGIHLIATAAAFGGAFALRSFAARVLSHQDDDPAWPWLAVGLWLLGPILLRHTMNGLETGLYAFVVLVTLLQFGRVLEQGAASGATAGLLLGALSGLAFLARNDGVFLVTAIFAVWAVDCLGRQGMSFIRTLARIGPPGLLCALLAAPWLITNQLRFGSIVPISGTSQSLEAGFAQNLSLLPLKLFEHMFPMLPVPQRFEDSVVLIWGMTMIVLMVLLWFLIGIWRKGGTIRLVVLAYLLHGVAISMYYGLFFGAPWFLSRYLSVMAPLLIIAAFWTVIDLLRATMPRSWPNIVAGAGLASIALCAALLARPFLPGAAPQGHFQVVSWVTEHVPQETWVGAVQTGTLGYWHDRTMNLDGKVNPAALAALQREGHVLNYVKESSIEYLADWVGITAWVDRDGFGDVFEVIVHDPTTNLGVLRRRNPVGDVLVESD